MTLPASGPLEFAEIAAEMGDTLPVTVPNNKWTVHQSEDARLSGSRQGWETRYVTSRQALRRGLSRLRRSLSPPHAATEMD